MKKNIFFLPIIFVIGFCCKKLDTGVSPDQITVEVPLNWTVAQLTRIDTMKKKETIGNIYYIDFYVTNTSQQDIYIGQTGQYGQTITGISAIALGFNNILAPNVEISSGNIAKGVTFSRSRIIAYNADSISGAFKINAGTKKHFQIITTIQYSLMHNPAPSIQYLRLVLYNIQYFSDKNLIGGKIIQFSPKINYVTGFFGISSD